MSAILEVQDVSKRFGGLTAVKNVSFSLQPGELTGILGPNGAGKTTLFNLLTGFIPPTMAASASRDRNFAASRPTRSSTAASPEPFN